jgi:crotonobetainyl-CoA:carnitine CoA-transferase CaiB-like acyl-CoA transferase
MYAYSNILAALLQRGKTGKGSVIDVSMLEALGEWMSFPMYYAFEGAQPPPRNGASHATIYPYGPFQAGDGGTVMLGLQNEREWVQFCEVVLENPALVLDERFDKNFKRNENRVELLVIIDQCFSKLTTEQVIAKLEKAQIANARLNDMKGLWNHQQLKDRDRWVNVDTPAGSIPALLPPGLNDSYDYRMDPIPSIGEHTNAILKELGLVDADIASMRSSGAI